MQSISAAVNDLRTAAVIAEHMTDVTGAQHVQVEFAADGATMWVNVNGICLLRICQIAELSTPRPPLPPPRSVFGELGDKIKSVLLPDGRTIEDRRKR